MSDQNDIGLQEKQSLIRKVYKASFPNSLPVFNDFVQVSIDRNGFWKELSASWQTFTTKNPSSSVGESAAEVVSPDHWEVFQKYLQRAASGEVLEGLDVQVSRGGDRWGWVRFHLSVCNMTGTQLKGFFYDVSDLKKAESKIDILSNVIDQAGNAVVIARVMPDQSCVTIFANQKFLELSGKSIDEVIFLSPTLMLSEKSNQDVVKDLSDALEKHQKFVAEIYCSGWKRQFWAELSITPIINNFDKASFLVISWRDISLEKEHIQSLVLAKTEAERASRSRSDFLALISHEVRTPLSGIMGMLDLMVDMDLDPEEMQYLKNMRDSGEMMLGLLNDILDFSKMEAGKFVIADDLFDPLDVLEQVIEGISARSQSKKISLNIVTSPDIPVCLETDMKRFRQLLYNLVGNAIKFTDVGGVTVFLGIEDDLNSGQSRLLIKVVDTGIGIPKAYQEKLFQAYSQAPQDGVKTDVAGTGLGLAITKKLIDLMGGSVGFTSVEGEGSTFWFSLPVKSKHMGQRLEDREKIHFETLKTAIVINNNVASRDALSLQLERFRVRVKKYNSVDALLTDEAGLKSGPVDWLFVDEETSIDQIRSDLKDAPLFKSSTFSFVKLLSMSQKRMMKELNIEDIPLKFLISPLKTTSLLGVLQNRDQKIENKQAVSPLGSIGDKIRAIAPKVLLAEDSLINSQVITLLLENEGCKVTAVVDGKAAVDAVMETDFDIVLMDVMMPVMGGFEATREIRSLHHDRKRHVPIIALTAHAMEGYREECLKNGMNDYAVKPVSRMVLLGKILLLLSPDAGNGLQASEQERSLGAVPSAVADDSPSDIAVSQNDMALVANVLTPSISAVVPASSSHDNVLETTTVDFPKEESKDDAQSAEVVLTQEASLTGSSAIVKESVVSVEVASQEAPLANSPAAVVELSQNDVVTTNILTTDNHLESTVADAPKEEQPKESLAPIVSVSAQEVSLGGISRSSLEEGAQVAVREPLFHLPEEALQNQVIVKEDSQAPQDSALFVSQKLEFDEAPLAEFLESLDAQTLRMLIEDFLNILIEWIPNIMDLSKGDNLKAFEREAHSLGSSAATFGAMQLCDLARTIERLCREQKFDDAKKLAQSLPTLTQKATSLLQAYLEKVG